MSYGGHLDRPSEAVRDVVNWLSPPYVRIDGLSCRCDRGRGRCWIRHSLVMVAVAVAVAVVSRCSRRPHRGKWEVG